MKTRFSIWSIIFSAISLFSNAILNYNLYSLFIKADKKTQALFGIIETSHLYYKIYIFIAGVIAFILSMMALKRKDTIARLAILLSIISMLLVFIRMWKLLI